MSELRASTKRPPSTPVDIVGNEVVDTGVRSASVGSATEMVTVRMDTDCRAALGRVHEHLGGSRSGVLRTAVEVVDEALRSPSLGAVEQRLLKAVAARRPAGAAALDEEALHRLADAVEELAAAYRSLSFQNQKVGNNHNQLTRLGNAGRVVDSDAVAAVGRELAGLTTAVESQGTLVSRVEEALACLRSSR
ncbi:MAG: hypothetical protein VB040_12975 [Propionibacterium sp.]|nr:hypothetical protein [Propionibacterium sp.]